MTVKLENRQALIDLARHYWLDKGYNILEAIKQAERDLEGCI
ncbi:hypothetical protein [Metaclostridioides mangenotii]|nr:hypothetical protein [Clostridioides mangenotii]